MTERLVWKNGNILPEKDAVMSVYDSSLMFGDMAFEMMRTFNKNTFKLREHSERLFKSLNILEIDLPYSFEELFNAHENLILQNRWSDDDEIRTLINVSRGILPIYQDMLGDEGKPNAIITCFPLTEVVKGMSKYYKTGVHAIVPSQRAIPEYLLDPKIKSRSRQHYMMANLEVKKYDKEAWALLLDTDGFITEGTGSNFFMFKDGRLITPKPQNCLRGISRDYVMKLDKEVIEKDIMLYDLYEADEAFFTCTPYSIMPITKINGKPVGSGFVGEKTKNLTNKWFEDVSCDWVRQMEIWDGN